MRIHTNTCFSPASLFAVLLLAVGGSNGFAAAIAPAGTPAIAPGADKTQLMKNYGKLPLSFEANHGQAAKDVKFVSRGSGYAIYLTAQEAVLALHKSEDNAARYRNALKTRLGHSPAALASSAPEKPGGASAPESSANVTDVIRMQLAGANAAVRPVGAGMLPGTANYFIGNDPAQWHRSVPTYGKVRYAGVYPGVDLVYYGNQRQLEYDFVVAPGASAQPIRLHFDGAKDLKVDNDGNLIIVADDGEVAFHRPVVYQRTAAGRQTIAGAFQLLPDHSAGFALGRYDHSKPLVIDPTLVYSTFLGGNYADYAVAIAVDAAGEAYVTGLTWSQDFPLTPGAIEAVNHATASNGVSTAFVSKFNASGTALLYSTYLGGNAIANTEHLQGDYGHSIAVDAAGEAFLTGWTYSTNFPITAGAFQTTNKAAAANSGATGFVTKLSASGTALIYSTFLGGSDFEQPLSIAIDSAGDAFTSGYTYSDDYPVTSGAYQTVNNGADNYGWNLFVTKLNPTGTGLVYSTYLGGSSEGSDGVDSLYVIFGVAVDKSGNAYVAAHAQSSDFPVTATAFQSVNNAAGKGGANITFSKFDPTGSKLLYSTYLGGSSYSGDFCEGVTVDSAGSAYITGYTYSSDFPVTKGAFQTINKSAANYENTGFVAKLNPAKSGAASLVYSTFLGGEFRRRCLPSRSGHFRQRLCQRNNGVDGFSRNLQRPSIDQWLSQRLPDRAESHRHRGSLFHLSWRQRRGRRLPGGFGRCWQGVHRRIHRFFRLPGHQGRV